MDDFMSYSPGASKLILPAPNLSKFVPNCILWLDADTGVFQDSGFATPAVNGNVVNGWRDQSLIANDCTSGAGPTLITGALNGKSVLHFTGNGNGSGQKFQTKINDISSGNTYWVVAVLSDGSVTW